MSDFQRDLRVHIQARYPIILVLTHEERRTREEVHTVVEDMGLTLENVRLGDDGENPRSPNGIERSDAAIWVCDDVHLVLDKPRVVRLLADIAHGNIGKSPRLIVLAPDIDIPEEIEHDVAVLGYALPDESLIREILSDICVEMSVLLTEKDAALLTRTCQGFTRSEVRRSLRKAFLQDPDGFSVDAALSSVVADKKKVLRSSRVLEQVEVPSDLQAVGGLDRLKGWLEIRKNAYSEEARRFGIPTPRGLLLMGVQGCGKSLTAKSVAGQWKLPLVRLDLSAVFGDRRPEAALRRALQVAEAMAPVVLWIDELEKGFEPGGSGPTGRILGGLVTWLQEKTKDVFVIATANKVESLPPELPRKGRFDEIFFVDLPNVHERAEILRLHLERRGRRAFDFDAEALARKGDRLTGSELEQVVISGLHRAFAQGRDLEQGDLEAAVKETIPLYETFEQEIKALREWARKRARPASTDRKKADLFAGDQQREPGRT